MTRTSWPITTPIRIPGVSVMSVSSASFEPMSAATPPGERQSHEHPAEDLGQEPLVGPSHDGRFDGIGRLHAAATVLDRHDALRQASASDVAVASATAPT
jgi:hypothetical protein